MKAVLHLLKEQYDNKHLILRLAAFEQRSKFLLHYLGALWQVFSPLMQVVVFFLLFLVSVYVKDKTLEERHSLFG